MKCGRAKSSMDNGGIGPDGRGRDGLGATWAGLLGGLTTASSASLTASSSGAVTLVTQASRSERRGLVACRRRRGSVAMTRAAWETAMWSMLFEALRSGVVSPWLPSQPPTSQAAHPLDRAWRGPTPRHTCPSSGWHPTSCLIAHSAYHRSCPDPTVWSGQAARERCRRRSTSQVKAAARAGCGSARAAVESWNGPRPSACVRPSSSWSDVSGTRVSILALAIVAEFPAGYGVHARDRVCGLGGTPCRRRP